MAATIFPSRGSGMACLHRNSKSCESAELTEKTSNFLSRNSDPKVWVSRQTFATGVAFELCCLLRRRYRLFVQAPDMPEGVKDGRNTMTIVSNL